MSNTRRRQRVGRGSLSNSTIGVGLRNEHTVKHPAVQPTSAKCEGASTEVSNSSIGVLAPVVRVAAAGIGKRGRDGFSPTIGSVGLRNEQHSHASKGVTAKACE
jgi:hypothetical protein